MLSIDPAVEHRGRLIISMLRYAKYAIATRAVDRNAPPDVIAYGGDFQRRTLKSVPPVLWIFFLACAIPLAFAIYTQHAWEDYYITFRTSRNLATGHGLVFNVGDRLQTFTSPLGMLLPALTSFLTGNGSDVTALWLFRALCIPAFGLVAALLFATTTRLRYPALAAVAMVGWLVTDAKSIDFTINGMETPFLLLGFAYAFWAMFGASRRPWLHLGVAWAGLMWARPDSFIYISLFAGAVFLFNQPDMTGRGRGAWLQLFLRAAPVAAMLYLPWLLFAWLYYGSPVPHTIVAKAVQAGPKTLAGFLQLLRHPLSSFRSSMTLDGLFMPSEVLFGGWPHGMRVADRLAAIACAVAWVMPGLRTETRAASFTLLGGLLYLSYFPPFPTPWYLCLPALFGFLILSGLFAQALSVTQKIAYPAASALLRFSLVAAWLTTLLAGSWLTVQSAKQLKLQQEIIEIGNRREIGMWLREHAAPGDAVLLEPLGYIGYFSGLKTYDVPGLSSREVVELERRYGGRPWGTLAAELRPEWLVLRPYEIAAIAQTHPDLLDEQYVRAHEFDVQDRIAHLSIYGREYLYVDSVFIVFHRRP